MSAEPSVLVICVKAITYLLLYNLHDCTFKLFFKYHVVQSCLPIADMLYSGHLVIAANFSWNQPNHVQNLIEKPMYSGHI